MDSAEQQKARRKEAHRRSMIVTGGMTVAAGLAAAWIAFAPRSLIPYIRLGGRAASQPAAPAASRGAMIVPWEVFSPQALARARALDRLVLLSLWASWSGSCKTMDETAYADPRVATLARQEAVAVRVDADERPDLVLRYLGAGWPTTALLLPSGEVLDSGTFMSADVLLRWFEAISEKYYKRRARVAKAAQEAAVRRRDRRASPAGEPMEVLSRARRDLEAGWQRRRQPLFARFDRLQMLTALPQEWAPALTRRGASSALALEDGARGGFYRALGPGDKVEPEKLLGAQAEALAYLGAADPAAAARTRGYVERVLTAASGGYYSSQAPDATVDRRLFCDENGRMAAAVLDDPGASESQKRHARRTVGVWWDVGRERGLARRRLDAGPRGLLGDQLGLLEGLLAALRAGDDKRLAHALELAGAVERELLDEQAVAFYDRPAAGEFPEGLDRIRFSGLNARARRVYLALWRAAGPGPQSARLKARADALGEWLWNHPEGLDPADLAELAAGKLRP